MTLRDMARMLPIKLSIRPEVRRNRDLLSRIESRFHLYQRGFSTKLNKESGNISARGRIKAEIEDVCLYLLELGFDIINDNATIGFNVSDLFNSRKRMSFTETANFTSDSEFQWRERQFNLSFTYRFNQKKQRQRRGGGDFDGEGFEGTP